MSVSLLVLKEATRKDMRPGLLVNLPFDIFTLMYALSSKRHALTRSVYFIYYIKYIIFVLILTMSASDFRHCDGMLSPKSLTLPYLIICFFFFRNHGWTRCTSDFNC